MVEIQNPILNDLFAKIQPGYTMPIKFDISGTPADKLVHSQSQEVLQPNGDLLVQIKDSPDVEYTLSHELMHMYLATSGYPQVQYHLLTGTPEVDKQHYATATALSTAALHAVVAEWQRAHGFLGEKQFDLLKKGFAAAIPPEPAGGDNLVIYRSLSLFDHMTLFVDGGTDAQKAQWENDFPQAYPLAQDLYQTLTQKALDTPFAYRRAVVNLFARFNALVQAARFQPLDNDEFATLPPVLSQRQLRLSLNQVFTLKHSAYRDRQTKQLAYVALGKGDRQNAFVLPLTDTSPAAMQSLYQQPLGEILDQYHIDYSLR